MRNKKFFQRIASMLIPILCLSTLPVIVIAENTQNETFFEELSELLYNQDKSNYFDEIELTIGSNILTVDGEEQILDVAPEIESGRTMLPIRAVAEATGADVDWDAETQTVIVTSAAGDEITCSIGSEEMAVNDEITSLDVAPYIKGGRTYLPVRAISEALELDVDWDQESYTVAISAPYQTARLLVLANELDVSGLGATAVLNDGTGMWVLQFASPTDAKIAASLLEANGVVVEPDLYIPQEIDETVDSNTLHDSHYSWGASNCNFDAYIERYSELFTTTVIVAVVDTGVDDSHPFLQGRVLNGFDFVNNDETPFDENFHGTHVAGIIIDCVGHAPVNILPVRVLDDSGSGTVVAVCAGIKYAANHGADIINLSLGGGHSLACDQAIEYAIETGCLVVVAAGNRNSDTSQFCPAHITIPGVVVVSAGDSNHDKMEFSNYGSSIDLMAPGDSISASVPGNTFLPFSGTSMAAPHVAAAAALLDLAWGKTLEPNQLEAKVRSATSYEGIWTNKYVGCGFLDLSKADDPNTVTPGIRLSKRNLSLAVGTTETLTAIVIPGGQLVTWSSSDSSVATVYDGAVFAVGVGNATITATCNGYSDSCEIIVSVPITSLQIIADKTELWGGEAESLKVIVSPSDANEATIRWSSDTAYVSVDDTGNISVMKNGAFSSDTAVITASCGSVSDSIVINIKNFRIKTNYGSFAYGDKYFHGDGISWEWDRFGYTVECPRLYRGAWIQLSIHTAPGAVTYSVESDGAGISIDSNNLVSISNSAYGHALVWANSEGQRKCILDVYVVDRSGNMLAS